MEVFMGFELIVAAVVSILAGAFLTLKAVAPKTETKWDDRIVDVVEGIAKELGVDPDELASKSVNKLKKEIVKKE
jgi:hypothetical protein